MYEYRIVVIGLNTAPMLEATMNKLGEKDWVYQGQIQFKHDVGLLFSRCNLTHVEAEEDVPPRAFQETLNRLAGR